MFSGCSSWKFLPDISKLNTSNVNSLSSMFINFTSLISLPDISKWDTKNVGNMISMFQDCTSLISFSVISKWDLNKIRKKDMRDMFKGVNRTIIPEKFKCRNID